MAAMPLLSGCGDDEPAASEATTTVRMRINGEDREVAVDNRTSLLDMLRERAGLPGTKKGCDRGPAARARFLSTTGGCCHA